MDIDHYLQHPDAYQLGSTDAELRVASSTDNRHAAQALAEQAKRSLHIFTRDLDAPVYDQAPFIQAVSALATRSRYSRILVLVQTTERAVKNGHRIIELSRRLSSFIELRKPNSDYHEYNQAFLIADEVGLLRRPIADRYDGALNFKAPLAAREYLDFFNQVWERSEGDPDLRQLHI
jgi:hypothetical protein